MATTNIAFDALALLLDLPDGIDIVGVDGSDGALKLFLLGAIAGHDVEVDLVYQHDTDGSVTLKDIVPKM